jgi:NAD(P)-dependent dehydrogenase (short-subunit alcohol dehydrogenase family)
MSVDTLQGRVAVVTGAGRGIGRALALRLAAAGAAVAVMARTEADVDGTAAQIRAGGGAALAGSFDVADAAAVRDFIARTETEHGDIDGLVNNAGRTGEWDGTPFWAADLDDWWSRIETNLRGPVNFCHAVLPAMVARGEGRVVNLNSLAGAAAAPWTDGAYPVSKAGVFRLTDQIAAQLAGAGADGVAVFDVSPGLVRTREGGPDLPASAWTPVERVCDLVVRIAGGDLDALSGRFLHAPEDIDAVIAQASTIREVDGRALRMRAGWDSDPTG